MLRSLRRKWGVAMNRPSFRSAAAGIPWILRPFGRLILSLLAAATGAFATLSLPVEMRLIICFDLAAAVYIGLFVGLMDVATPEQAAELAHSAEPNSRRTLICAALLSLISLVAVAALMHLDNASRALRMIHLGTSLAAVCLAWMLAHILFGLHYMHRYYHDPQQAGGGPYDQGMRYTDKPTPDYWDFMYYAFTVAMCYGTTDVVVTSTSMRRVTLVHGIFSFFFVAAIVGLVVNALSTVF
jgi:uncharacterized membrane protein